MENKKFGKKDSLFFRAIATIMVIIAHYSGYIYELSGNKIWNLLSKIGRYGVALFFLVSGYGLVYSIKDKKIDYHFLFYRIKSLYLPFTIMQIFALTYIGKPYGQMSINDWFYYFIGMDYWYVLVIFLLYCCFYISIKYFMEYFEVVLFILVSVLNISFVLAGCDEWWYLTNYVFCLGVFLAIYEGKYKVDNLQITILLFWGFVVSSFVYPRIDKIIMHDLIKIVAAICFAGCIWFVYILIPIQLYSKPINYIGKCSLYIYVFHTHALNLMYKYEEDSYVVIVLSIIVVMLASVVFGKIMDKLMNIQKRRVVSIDQS